MKTKTGQRDNDAARRYVEVVDQPARPAAERRLLSWLERDVCNADALARCDVAVEIAQDLANDPAAGWAFREARWLATAGRARPRRLRRWLASPALAWSVAGVCAAFALLSFQRFPDEGRQTAARAELPDGARQEVAGRPADFPGEVRHEAASPPADFPDTLALALASAHPVVVLPGNVVVDANSLAVLPFASGPAVAPPGVAATLHDDLVSALAAIPGLYPVGGNTVAPYAGTDLPVAEVAAQLGTRGIVNGTVAVDGGRLSVRLSLTDASTGRLLLEAGYERGTGDLHALEREMATAIALALAHSTRPAVTVSRQ